MVRAVHRDRTGVGSIPAEDLIVDEFSSTVPCKNFDLCMIYSDTFPDSVLVLLICTPEIAHWAINKKLHSS